MTHPKTPLPNDDSWSTGDAGFDLRIKLSLDERDALKARVVELEAVVRSCEFTLNESRDYERSKGAEACEAREHAEYVAGVLRAATTRLKAAEAERDESDREAAQAQADRITAEAERNALKARLLAAQEEQREACAVYFALRDRHGAGPAIIRETPLEATPLADRIKALEAKLYAAKDLLAAIRTVCVGYGRNSKRGEVEDVIDLKARVAELEANFAADVEYIGALQDDLAAEKVAHLATSRERDAPRLFAAEKLLENVAYPPYDDEDMMAVAERVRDACHSLVDCNEGGREYVMQAVRALDLSALVKGAAK